MLFCYTQWFLRENARCGLEHPLFVAQTMWFGMPAACGAKGELVEYGIEDYEVRQGNNVNVGFSLGKAPMWHVN